jgi:cold shock CspA family protein
MSSDFDSVVEHCNASSPKPQQPKQSPTPQGPRLKGRVKFFDARGYGFVRAEDGSEAFFHAKALAPHYRSPGRRDLVEFSVIDQGGGRTRAINIHLIERAPGHVD